MKKDKVHSILLIDDSSMDNFINKKIIEHCGFVGEVVVKNSAPSALEYLQQLSLAKLPEYIFLDINMPAYDGFDFLNEYEKLSESIKSACSIVVLTNSDKQEDISKMGQYDLVKKYMIKPLTVENLLSSLELK